MYIFISHCLIHAHLDSFNFLTLVNRELMNMVVSISVIHLKAFGCVPGSGGDGSDGISSSSF